MADVQIVCEDGAVFAHRLVLAAASPNFLKKLFLSIPETEDEQTVKLFMPEVRLDDLDRILRLIYKGETHLDTHAATSCIKLMSALGISLEKLLVETTVANVNGSKFPSSAATINSSCQPAPRPNQSSCVLSGPPAVAPEVTKIVLMNNQQIRGIRSNGILVQKQQQQSCQVQFKFSKVSG